jgi:hypothetical protein
MINITDINGNSYGNSKIIIIGADGKVKTAGGGGGGGTNYERRSDYVYPYQYSGTAPVGTLDSGTWIIKRIDFTTPGSPTTLSATGAWTNRYSLTYI